jgi:hypothetical protein
MLSVFLVTIAWRVLRLRMKKMASRYGEVSENTLNKHSMTADM